MLKEKNISYSYIKQNVNGFKVLSQSDVPLDEVSSEVLSYGHDAAFIVPTETAFKKSIMDAHASLRRFLSKHDIHEYETQKQGVKYRIDATYVGNQNTSTVMVSMYRPETKSGDPRIWFYGLKKLAKPRNLLALIVAQGNLFIVNCSQHQNIVFALTTVIPKPTDFRSLVALELLDKLKIISQKGFIPTIVNGDTGVGMTLEAELGLVANSSKQPDYKGIELKASRVDANHKQRNRKQLLSKTPNWKLSPIKNARNLILQRGYIDSEGHHALRHTVGGKSPNSLGLFLDIDFANDYLRQMYAGTVAADFSPVHDMTWLLEDLRSALKKKHKETFWVKAMHNNNRVSEAFHYVLAEHTVNPYIDRLETLIETGLITLDYTLHIKPSGKVRDHGYLFKLQPNSIEALFPKPLSYDLTTL